MGAKTYETIRAENMILTRALQDAARALDCALMCDRLPDSEHERVRRALKSTRHVLEL
jgi:hypothetical protein